MLNTIATVGFTALLMLTSASALHASVITSSSGLDNLNLSWGHTESEQLQVFSESQNTEVGDKQIRVDYLLGDNLFVGDSLTGVSRSNSGLTLEEGSYNSHFLHFDPIGTSSGKIYDTRIDFGEDIIAIILGGQYLAASDSVFGGENTNYQHSSSRQMETHDFLSFESSQTILVDRLWVGKYWVDDARIITQSVPEPGSWALLGLGLIGLVGARAFSTRSD